MKNNIKYSIVGALLVISTGIFAQEGTKKDKKQEPKTEKQAPTTKKDSAADTTKKGGTRMAINEQGMPAKKDKTKTSTTTTKTEPTSKDK